MDDRNCNNDSDPESSLRSCTKINYSDFNEHISNNHVLQNCFSFIHLNIRSLNKILTYLKVTYNC